MLQHAHVNGHPAIRLENDLLRVAVLPGKGADVCEFVHRPSGVDFLLKTPAGLRPPGPRPPADFLENYEGGWQELLPNANDACQYRGAQIPFHGEVALLPWDWVVERDDEAESAVRLTVRCRQTPFRLERVMRLRQREPALELVETLTNDSPSPADFVWGHHLVLGGSFLGAGCRLELPASLLVTPEELYEPATARLAPGQREPWPWARGRRPGDAQRIDLRAIPGPEAHTHDDAYLTGLAQGYAAVTNPRLALTFRLEWDPQVFPWVVLWQPYGGADLPPLTGIYGLGLEPWTSRFNLEQAVRHGQARTLEGGQSLTTTLRASVWPASQKSW